MDMSGDSRDMRYTIGQEHAADRRAVLNTSPRNIEHGDKKEKQMSETNGIGELTAARDLLGCVISDAVRGAMMLTKDGYFASAESIRCIVPDLMHDHEILSRQIANVEKIEAEKGET